jgi:acetyl-CoA decarbonylase/synthase, CODH/ACS complex subunit gamma
MAMTGLQIFKLLPKTNCGECGVPTCLAFAMKLAAKVADPTTCPYITEESLAILGVSQAPPVRKISFGLQSGSVELGAETVMYRHEKTFVNRPLLCFELSDSLNDDDFSERLARCRALRFDRVGEVLSPDGFALTYDSQAPDNFLKKFRLMDRDRIVVIPELPLDVLRDVLTDERNPSRLIIRVAAGPQVSSVAALVAGGGAKLAISADDDTSLFAAVQEADAKGAKDLILHLRSVSLADMVRNNTLLRRMAIVRNCKPAGYPLFAECGEALESAVAAVCKYASVVVLKSYSPEIVFPLLTLRQNIYTDPQKPLQIRPGLYKIGEPDGRSPLMVTTNFSLTYFIVSGEIDNSPYSAWLMVTDSEGMSVLTAWSANKFSAGLIAKAVQSEGLEKELTHRKLIIPGYVSILKGEIEESLPGWEIEVGPQEAADISIYLKETWAGPQKGGMPASAGGVQPD